MAKQSTFSVSRRGVEPVEVNFLEPENINDERWTELGVTQEGINELAVQSLVIKIQAGARNKLDEGQKEVQAFVDGYKYGQRSGGGGVRKVVIKAEDAQKAGFTAEQIALLKAAGVTLPGMGDDEEASDAENGESSDDEGTEGEDEGVEEETPSRGRGR